MNRHVIAIALAAGLSAAAAAAQAPAANVPVPYAVARRILDALRPELWPAELRGQTDTEREARWPAWIAARERVMHARVDGGDEDSIVHLLLFGTSFTARPRATDRDLAALVRRPADGLRGLRARIDDFAAALAAPGTDTRLRFARQVVERQGMTLATATGRAAVRRYLDARTVAVGGAVSSSRLLDPSASLADKLTIFRDRGLSSDTSIFIDFAVDEALADIARRARLAPGSVRRVAIVGPGLDFADKQQGYDFYPEQTLQPFAVIDALVGLGLSSESDLTLTVFDLSPRVLAHLETAAAAAQAGHLYRLVLPRSLDRPWSLGLASYWQRFGSHIGAPIAAPAPPPGAGRLEVRGVGVRPAIAAGIATRRLNIVLERPPSAEDGGRFDLVVVTNLLLYYDVFEQSLALENIAAMLRPGGLLLSNNRAIELPNAGLRSVGTTSVVYMTLAGIGEAGDQIVWYAR